MEYPLHSDFQPVYTTEFGQAYCCDSAKFLKTLPSESIDLIVTSPPYALIKKKSYGNESTAHYVDWFIDNFGAELMRVLKPTGSLVIDIGGSWNKGKPTRSLYHFELLIRLCKEIGFHLAQEFFWYNPAKMPSPAQWVTIERIRVKDAVNAVWWLSKSERPKANNKRVLTPYKKSMKQLLKVGYNDGPRPSGHNVSKKWGIDNGGAIPPNMLNYHDADLCLVDNLLEVANTCSSDRYLSACRSLGMKAHPARFPRQLPQFFIEFLTEPGDLVYDPFGGSCVTGEVSEELKRQWITSEIDPSYVLSSKYRFFDFEGNCTVEE